MGEQSLSLYPYPHSMASNKARLKCPSGQIYAILAVRIAKPWFKCHPQRVLASLTTRPVTLIKPRATKKNANNKKKNSIAVMLTHACDPISSVSLVTGTGEATRSVGTGSIRTTVVITRRSTLIYIYHHKHILASVSRNHQLMPGL